MKKYFAFFEAFFLATVFLHAKTIVVSSQSDLVKIIDNTNDGDHLILNAGTYFAYNISVNKQLIIEGRNGAVINGMGKGTIFQITADSVTFLNLTIQNTGISYVDDLAGIKITKATDCKIKNCTLKNCFFGIYLSKARNCFILNNTVTGTAINESQTGNAIHLFTCRNISVEGNKLEKHRDGIYLEFTSDSRIKNNESLNHVRYGLHFMFSNNNEYFKNKFAGNGAGVAVMYSDHIYMHENIFADNWSSIANGILLKDIKDSKIEKNLIKKNTIGIYAEGVMRTSIINNNITNNGWALKILGNCEGNQVKQNNFIANTFEVVTNSFSNNNTFSENYWSNYTGYDLNKDHIGDIPHSPVKLFTYLAEEVPSAVILMRSLFIDLLDLAEKMTPVITPATLTDNSPKTIQNVW